MAEKKNILTYEGLRKLEEELEDLKVVKRKEISRRSKKLENRATYLKMRNTMLQKMNSVTSKQESNRLKKS